MTTETEDLPVIYSDVDPSDVAKVLRQRRHEVALKASVSPGKDLFITAHQKGFAVTQQDRFTEGETAQWPCDASHVYIVATDPETEFVPREVARDAATSGGVVDA